MASSRRVTGWLPHVSIITPERSFDSAPHRATNARHCGDTAPSGHVHSSAHRSRLITHQSSLITGYPLRLLDGVVADVGGDSGGDGGEEDTGDAAGHDSGL